VKRFPAILLLSVFLILILSSTASAHVPRWPEPAWFAQFYSTPTPQPAPAPAPEPQPTPAPAPQPGSITTAEQHIFTAINSERVSRGVAPLKINPTLVELARKKSQDMIDNNYFAHRSPVYGSAYDMIRSAGLRYNYAGENLARTSTAANAVTLFINSSTHRNTLLNTRFSETGIGVVQSGSRIYVTQMFIGFIR
jgi:uncharacterized protein YkwD